MASWAEVERSAPGLAAAVRERFDAGVHKTLATLRRDGAPRISGIEARFDRGELWFGSMPGALKARDLQRDARFALHSASEDPPGWSGDAKLAGRAVEEDPEVLREVFDQAPPGPAHLFRAEIDEVVLVGLDEGRDRLVIELWRPGEPVRRIERE